MNFDLSVKSDANVTAVGSAVPTRRCHKSHRLLHPPSAIGARTAGPIAERQAESTRSIGFSGLKPGDPIHILRAASFTRSGETDASVITARLSAVRR